MYRPNRIGPWPLVSVVTGPHVRGNLVSNDLSGAPQAHFSKTGANEATMSVHWKFNAALTIGALQGVAIGAKVVGPTFYDEGQFILSYAGALIGFSDDEGLGIRGIIGQTADVGELDSALNQYSFVPTGAYLHERTSGAENAPVTIDANGSVVLGDWAPQDASFSRELFFGFFLVNGGGVEVSVNNLEISASLHVYVSDLVPFDPNR